MDRQIPEDDDRFSPKLKRKKVPVPPNLANFAKGKANRIQSKHHKAALMAKIKRGAGKNPTAHELHLHHVNHKTHQANEYRKNLHSKNPVNK